LTSFSINSP